MGPKAQTESHTNKWMMFPSVTTSPRNKGSHLRRITTLESGRVASWTKGGSGSLLASAAALNASIFEQIGALAGIVSTHNRFP